MRKKFRIKRGENPAGGPGEKIMYKNDTDAGNDGGNDGDVNNSASENLAKNGKRRGPPVGHNGVSHHNKATLPPICAIQLQLQNQRAVARQLP